MKPSADREAIGILCRHVDCSSQVEAIEACNRHESDSEEHEVPRFQISEETPPISEALYSQEIEGQQGEHPIKSRTGVGRIPHDIREIQEHHPVVGRPHHTSKGRAVSAGKKADNPDCNHWLDDIKANQTLHPVLGADVVEKKKEEGDSEFHGDCEAGCGRVYQEKWHS